MPEKSPKLCQFLVSEWIFRQRSFKNIEVISCISVDWGFFIDSKDYIHVSVNIFKFQLKWTARFRFSRSISLNRIYHIRILSIPLKNLIQNFKFIAEALSSQTAQQSMTIFSSIFPKLLIQRNLEDKLLPLTHTLIKAQTHTHVLHSAYIAYTPSAFHEARCWLV